ncbi:hypothetical protein [Arthrobacter pityocampae]|uniref:hypothetical protein n=1 Tax=Arthrobacter pityocampae TaxID=547334 RepID=UPI003735E369
MTEAEPQPQAVDDPETGTRRGFLGRFLQIMAIGSWIPLAYFGLSLLGYRSAGGPIVVTIGSGLLLSPPWLTLFASLSFFVDRRATRWWVWPSNLAFLVLSIGPSVLYGYLQFMALALLIGGPMVVD